MPDSTGLNVLTFEFSLLLIEKLFLSIPYAFTEIFNTIILSTSFYSDASSVCLHCTSSGTIRKCVPALQALHAGELLQGEGEICNIVCSNVAKNMQKLLKAVCICKNGYKLKNVNWRKC